jgi:metal-responsive CopG/Arc/MetJ family transcriptional regulator
MRTTFTLDDDVAAEVERRRRERGVGISEVVNDLIREAMVRRPKLRPYNHRSESVGLKIDVANIGDVLDLLDSAADDAP